MADILIRGMEMPEKCGKCFLRFGQCKQRIYMERRPDGCPLVPLPEKHGRLIDAEAFEDAFIRYYLEQERSNNLVFAAVEIKQHLADMIGDWPTIVPAEGGKADG